MRNLPSAVISRKHRGRTRSGFAFGHRRVSNCEITQVGPPLGGRNFQPKRSQISGIYAAILKLNFLKQVLKRRA